MYEMRQSHLSIYKYFTKHQQCMTITVSKGDIVFYTLDLYSKL